ncbi:FkbM family methyltransferase [Neolewinella lacunae]|uniref:FkbM family methyltransferase n=1 Tax=Neolewinella lacunae TaxID=1517758 RepID=A0A923PKA3_9BACT|nr:FkbM family methyltransferase [Neolewinella lacunae]MBC6994115.1 FkbM family methyltransferase [Neolewinella lacunae]MDN3636736.1 FkbM family methyltransferase [Neolewinella lacunae]
MSIAKKIQDFLAARGLYVQLKPPHELRRRRALLRHHGIEMVLDVGANVGQYGGELRQLGYTGTIHSFEPTAAAFAALQAVAAGDPQWQVHQLALGAAAGVGEINVSQNSYSSSLRDLLPEHLEGAPDSVYVAKETIQLSTVDEQFAALRLAGKKTYLKIDTQGYEREVLKGAQQSLGDVRAIQLEISLVPLYDQGLGLEECMALLTERGFRLVGLEPGFYHSDTGEQLQVDGIFVR